jgi:hypothetical protein
MGVYAEGPNTVRGRPRVYVEGPLFLRWEAESAAGQELYTEGPAVA